MSKPRDTRQKDLLRPSLDQITDLDHPLVRLAREIDWDFLDSRFSSVRHQRQRQRGRKLYSLHAPEVECIGKGKARAPCEFGCKSLRRRRPGSKSRPRSPNPKAVSSCSTPRHCTATREPALGLVPRDSHTLGPVVAEMEKLTGVEVQRIHVDKGYRGHSYPNKFRVWISGQERRVTKTICCEMKRRAAVEPVIGHIKNEHRMDRNYLMGHEGNRANAVLAVAGYNLAQLLRWFEVLLRALLAMIFRTTPAAQLV